jgi:hypothetical protein
LLQAGLLQRQKNDSQHHGVNPRAPGRKAGKPRPLEARQKDEQRHERGKRRPRQQKKRGEQRGDEDRRRAHPYRELTFQATSARFAASICSLVRPKRRSRLW